MTTSRDKYRVGVPTHGTKEREEKKTPCPAEENHRMRLLTKEITMDHIDNRPRKKPVMLLLL